MNDSDRTVDPVIDTTKRITKWEDRLIAKEPNPDDLEEFEFLMRLMECRIIESIWT